MFICHSCTLHGFTHLLSLFLDQMLYLHGCIWFGWNVKVQSNSTLLLSCVVVFWWGSTHALGIVWDTSDIWEWQGCCSNRGILIMFNKDGTLLSVINLLVYLWWTRLTWYMILPSFYQTTSKIALSLGLTLILFLESIWFELLPSSWLDMGIWYRWKELFGGLIIFWALNGLFIDIVVNLVEVNLRCLALAWL